MRNSPPPFRPFLFPVLLSALTLGACGQKEEEGQTAEEGQRPRECSDGADNDGDGLYDCDDSSCAGSSDCEGGGGGNAAPSGAAVAITPHTPADDDDLDCTIQTEATDPNGDTISYRYAWSVNGEDAGLADAHVAAALTGAGDTWSCTVTPSDGTLDGPAATDTVTVKEANHAPSTPSVSISPADPYDDDDLLCVIDAPSTDADGDAITYTYRWTVDGADAGIDDTSVRAALTDAGQAWGCEVTADDGEASSVPGRALVRIGSAPASDTAYALISYRAEFITSPNYRNFISGSWGYNVTSLTDGAQICEEKYTFYDDGVPAVSGCPGCQWSFSLTMNDGTATGAGCAKVGEGMDGTSLNGFSASWGFATSYTYNYSGTDYELSEVLFYGTSTYGWSYLLYNYGGYGYGVGTPDHMTWDQPVGYVYYYL